jgi:hypothetical protein
VSIAGPRRQGPTAKFAKASPPRNFLPLNHRVVRGNWNGLVSKRKVSPREGRFTRRQLIRPASLAFDRRKGGYWLSADPDKKEEE